MDGSSGVKAGVLDPAYMAKSKGSNARPVFDLVAQRHPYLFLTVSKYRYETTEKHKAATISRDTDGKGSQAAGC
jgi:hypothetical protein